MFNDYLVQHTHDHTNPWLRVDLETLRYVCGVKVWNRQPSPLNCKLTVNISTTIPQLSMSHQFHLISAVNQRFKGPKFGVSESIDDIQDSSRLCAEQDRVLPGGAVQYFACTQGGVLTIDRSRLFMAGRYMQLTLHSPKYYTNLHIQEMEVHGY